MRLFIACQFSRGSTTGDGTCKGMNCAGMQKGNFTRSGNFSSDPLPSLEKSGERRSGIIKLCMKQSAGPDFNMKLLGIGCFPRKDGSIYWLGIAGAAESYTMRFGKAYIAFCGRRASAWIQSRFVRISQHRSIRMDLPTKTIRMVPIISRADHIF